MIATMRRIHCFMNTALLLVVFIYCRLPRKKKVTVK